MSLLYAYSDCDFKGKYSILDKDGRVVTPGGGDKIRITIGRQGQEPKFRLSSDNSSDKGSAFVKGSQNQLTIVKDDLQFSPGVYTLSFDYWSSGSWFNVSNDVFVLEGAEA